MTNETLHRAATGAYRTIQSTHMSGVEVLLELYKGMIFHVQAAKNAYLDADLEKMCRHNDKVYKILIALQSHLDHESGEEVAVFLNDFYNSVFASLTSILRNPRPEQGFSDILQSLEHIYAQWTEIACGQDSAAAGQP